MGAEQDRSRPTERDYDQLLVAARGLAAVIRWEYAPLSTATIVTECGLGMTQDEVDAVCAVAALLA